jgi:FKBP-type peptidyl-prolyl cis-trans isomerase 2
MSGHHGGDMLEPGQRVRLPGQPDWGEGQVQSVVGARVTVNFEHAGKVLIQTDKVALEIIAAAPSPR